MKKNCRILAAMFSSSPWKRSAHHLSSEKHVIFHNLPLTANDSNEMAEFLVREYMRSRLMLEDGFSMLLEKIFPVRNSLLKHKGTIPVVVNFCFRSDKQRVVAAFKNRPYNSYKFYRLFAPPGDITEDVQIRDPVAWFDVQAERRKKIEEARRKEKYIQAKKIIFQPNINSRRNWRRKCSNTTTSNEKNNFVSTKRQGNSIPTEEFLKRNHIFYPPKEQGAKEKGAKMWESIHESETNYNAESEKSSKLTICNTESFTDEDIEESIEQHLSKVREILANLSGKGQESEKSPQMNSERKQSGQVVDSDDDEDLFDKITETYDLESEKLKESLEQLKTNAPTKGKQKTRGIQNNHNGGRKKEGALPLKGSQLTENLFFNIAGGDGQPLLSHSQNKTASSLQMPESSKEMEKANRDTSVQRYSRQSKSSMIKENKDAKRLLSK